MYDKSRANSCFQGVPRLCCLHCIHIECEQRGGGCLVLSRVAPCLVSWKCWMTTTADGGNPQTHRRVIVGRRLVSFVLLASNARQGLHPSTSS